PTSAPLDADHGTGMGLSPLPRTSATLETLSGHELSVFIFSFARAAFQTHACSTRGIMKVGLLHVPYQVRGGEDIHVELLAQTYREIGAEIVLIPQERIPPRLNLQTVTKSLSRTEDFPE